MPVDYLALWGMGQVAGFVFKPILEHLAVKAASGFAEDYLKLEAMDATTYDLNRIRLDRLFIAQHVREFTEFVQQAFELPKEYQQRIKLLGQLQEQAAEQGEVSRFRKAYLKRSPQSVLQLVQNRINRLLVVLGDPGSGKSSLLQFTALQWAEYPGHDLGTLEVPFLIELREYARNRQDGVAKDFLEYLHKGAGVVCRFDQHAIAARLRDRREVLTLLDLLSQMSRSRSFVPFKLSAS